MSNNPLPEKYIKLAREKEVSYDWDEAAENYQLAISVLNEKEKYLEAGEIQERVAYCIYRAAYQSKTKEEFKVLLESASYTYGKAAEIYETLEDPRKEARILVNRVMEHFYSSWLIEEPVQRKIQVEECVREFKVALETCEIIEDKLRYGRVSNDFLAVLFSFSELSFTQIDGLGIIEEALDYGLKALKALKQEESGYEYARCYYLMSLFLPDRPLDVVESVNKQKELLQLGMGYAETALTLSEKVGDPYLIGLSCGILSLYHVEVKGDIETAMPLARKQLEIGELTRDRLVLARANEYLSYYTGSWIAVDEEDRDRIKAAANEGFRHANEAISHYKIILNPILTAFLGRNTGPTSLGKLETDLELKQKYETEALEATHIDLEYASKSGSLLGQMYTYLVLGSSYLSLAKLERDEYKKNKMLNESMRFNKKYIDSATHAQPFRYWNISIAYNKLIDVRGQLAKSENDPDRQMELLLEAIGDMEKSLELFNTHISVHDIIVYRQNYAVAQIRFGEILFHMHLLSNENQYLERAIQVFDDAVETYKKSDMPSYVAEILWKKAWAYYQKQEHSKSATEFDGASRYYYQAGEKYPNQRSFYYDYGSYMEAWGNIARAMDYHARDEYFLEKEFFEKAVNRLTPSGRWKYMSPNYQAWARLAEAEDQSRNEHCERAIELFQESSKLYSSAKESIEGKIASIGVRDEANMATELITASDLRMDYCLARVALEQAKILDRRGEHTASSRRYGEAAQIFLKIVEALESESEQREIRPLYSLCLAWQKMTQAEAEASSDLYVDASVLFEEAREHSPNEKTRLLTMGHASFCRALGAGIQYEVSREEHLHQELVRYIGSATDFYVRAGFDSALEYSRATQRLFEAYQYMDRARAAGDPVEKSRYFMAAERLLGVSAEAFQRAKHPEKRDEIVKLLQNLKQDREIAVSLSEILDTPGISSSTESFRAPTPSHEYPVGLESFEHADIQAKIFLPDDTVTTGEDFDIELEFYNPGKTTASLVHVEELIPDDFEVSGVSGMYRFSDKVLDLRGKRIGPLSTVEISLKVRPHSKGEFTLEPHVVFIDDTGEQRFSEPEPANIVVREMGILSWLRGTRPSF